MKYMLQRLERQLLVLMAAVFLGISLTACRSGDGKTGDKKQEAYQPRNSNPASMDELAEGCTFIDDFEIKEEDLDYKTFGDSFTVDDNGYLYVVTSDDNLDKMIYDEKTGTYLKKQETEELSAGSGKIEDKNILTEGGWCQTLSIYGPDGQLSEEYEYVMATSGVSAMTIGNGKIYMALMESGDRVLCTTLYAVDMENMEAERIAEYDDIYRIESMTWENGRLYAVGVCPELMYKEYELNENTPDYIYKGECLMEISPDTGEYHVLDVPFPIYCFGNNSGILSVYLYDEEAGYQLMMYNTHNKLVEYVSGVPKFSFLGIGLSDISTVVYVDINHRSINYVDITNPDAEAQLVTGTDVYGLFCKGGAVFYRDINENTIKRVKISAHVKDNAAIKYLTAEQYMYEEPYGCGYNINKSVVTEDEFALKVLAGDKDYDMCIMSSDYNIASNIKENGVFYPLNDVAGVMEYLDALHPQLKEAAINDRGEVWMLPVSMDVYMLVCNDEICDSEGISFENMTYMDFMKNMYKWNSEDSMSIEFSSYMLKNIFLEQYFRYFDTADTQIFREAVEYLFEREQAGEAFMWSADISNSIVRGENPYFYCALKNGTEAINSFVKYAKNNSNYSFVSVPGISKADKPAGSCMFLAVNPYTENPDTVLSYISDLSKYMINTPATYMFSDYSLYEDTALVKDVYDIYSNTDISFAVPSEVYAGDFNKYLAGDMELEEMIEEIDRKYKTYMNE